MITRATISFSKRAQLHGVALEILPTGLNHRSTPNKNTSAQAQLCYVSKTLKQTINITIHNTSLNSYQLTDLDLFQGRTTKESHIFKTTTSPSSSFSYIHCSHHSDWKQTTTEYEQNMSIYFQKQLHQLHLLVRKKD